MPKLLESVRDAIRTRHYSIRTEEAYIGWIKQYILYFENWLMASLLYGSGLRLMECLRLRVNDVDFPQLQVTVRRGKGDKDRVTVLPSMLVEPLRRQLERAKAFHDRDLREGLSTGLASDQTPLKQHHLPG